MKWKGDSVLEMVKVYLCAAAMLLRIVYQILLRHVGVWFPITISACVGMVLEQAYGTYGIVIIFTGAFTGVVVKAIVDGEDFTGVFALLRPPVKDPTTQFPYPVSKDPESEPAYSEGEKIDEDGQGKTSVTGQGGDGAGSVDRVE